MTFDIVTNKDFEIFQLSEMTGHGIFTIVSYGQKYLFRNNIFTKVYFLFKFQIKKIPDIQLSNGRKEKGTFPWYFFQK